MLGEFPEIVLPVEERSRGDTPSAGVQSMTIDSDRPDRKLAAEAALNRANAKFPVTPPFEPVAGENGLPAYSLWNQAAGSDPVFGSDPIVVSDVNLGNDATAGNDEAAQEPNGSTDTVEIFFSQDID